MKTFSDQDYQLDAKYADHEGPPAAPDCMGRTAGGLGGAAPASLDSYSQSRNLRNVSPPVRILIILLDDGFPDCFIARLNIV